MQISVKFISEDHKTRILTYDVEIDKKIFRVFCDRSGLTVMPEEVPPESTRTFFGWSDWIFDNVRTDDESCCIIAALAVALKKEKV